VKKKEQPWLDQKHILVDKVLRMKRKGKNKGVRLV
jgi:hypothetical protein